MNELLDYLHETYEKYMLERWKNHPKYGNGFSLGVIVEDDNVYHSDVHDTLEECIQVVEAKIEAGLDFYTLYGLDKVP